MKKIRKISPFISLCLALLIFAGSTGYSYIVPPCHQCMVQEVKHSIEIASNSHYCSCGECLRGGSQHLNGTHGYTLRHHCSSEQVEKMLSSELVKTDVQSEIMPFYLVSALILTFTHEPQTDRIVYPSLNTPKYDFDITTLYCQILA